MWHGSSTTILSWPKCHPNCSKWCARQHRWLSSAPYFQKTYSEKRICRFANDNNTRLQSVRAFRQKEVTLEREAYLRLRVQGLVAEMAFQRASTPSCVSQVWVPMDHFSESCYENHTFWVSITNIIFISPNCLCELIFCPLNRIT